MNRVALFLLLMIAACEQSNPEPPSAESTGVVESVADPLAVAPAELKNQNPVVKVFYRHRSLDGLFPVKCEIVGITGIEDQIKQVIDLLSIPPPEPEAIPIWPANTYIREAFALNDGSVVVDFDAGFVDSLAAGTAAEEYYIYSLVYSILDNFPDYKRVRILVDGTVRESFLGHIDIEFPLERTKAMKEIVREFNKNDEIIVEDIEPVKDGASSQAP